MTLAAIDWLSISIDLLLIVFVIVTLLMSLLILMQRPKQEGLGAAFGSGMTDQMFGARTTNVLQKGTVYLASLFFILTLTLAILYAKKNDYTAQTQVQEVVEEEAPVVEEPAVEEETAPSLEDELNAVIGDDEPATTEDGASDDATTEPATGSETPEPAVEEEATPDDGGQPAEETGTPETPDGEETPAGE